MSTRRTALPFPRSVDATRLYLQVLDLADLDHLERVAAEVAPQL